jgi:hypothetical protein
LPPAALDGQRRQLKNRIASAKAKPAILLREKPLMQAGGAAWTGEHTGGRHPVPARRTLEPVSAVAALGFGHPLFFFALRTDAVHLPLLDVVGKDEGTAGTFRQIALADLGAAVGGWADENGFAGAAPEFSLGRLFAHRALVHIYLFIPQ